MTHTATAVQWAKVESSLDAYFSLDRSAAFYTNQLSRPCPICGANDYSIVQHQPSFQFFSDGGLSKRMHLIDVQCQQCFALYKNPTYSPEGMRVLFAEAGQSYGHGGHAQDQVDWLQAQGLLEGRSSVLDVGCGAGRFLSLMPESWMRRGIEPDEALARETTEAARGAYVFTGDKWPAQLVDLITMWHVLEHVPDPIATLKQLRALAHPNTRLVVEVPILELGATPDITGFLTPQHVTHFSEASAVAALARSGWLWVQRELLKGYNGFRLVAIPVDAMRVHANRTDEAALARYRSMQEWNRLDVEARTKQLTAPQCVIWGAGMHTESLYQQTSLFKAERTYVLVDSDPKKQGTTWRGIPVYAPSAIMPYVNWAETQLLVSSYGDQAAIREAALNLGVPESRIVLLYDPAQVRSY